VVGLREREDNDLEGYGNGALALITQNRLIRFIHHTVW
jgi:hypothetical protein